MLLCKSQIVRQLFSGRFKQTNKQTKTMFSTLNVRLCEIWINKPGGDFKCEFCAKAVFKYLLSRPNTKRTLQKTNMPNLHVFLFVLQLFRVVHKYCCVEFGKYLNISQKSMRTRTNSQKGHKCVLCPRCHKIFYCT